MSVHQVPTGCRDDEEAIRGFFAYLARARPEWHRFAACRGQGPEPWFPSQYERPTAEALEVCAICPVQTQCATAGAAERFGWWGGMSPRDRVPLRRAEAVPA